MLSFLPHPAARDRRRSAWLAGGALLLLCAGCEATYASPLPAPPAPTGSAREELVPHMSDGFWSSLTEIAVDGAIVPVEGTVPSSLRRPASVIMACPLEQTAGRWVQLGSPHDPLLTAFVEGCGQRIVYALVLPSSTAPNAHAEFVTLSRVQTAPAASAPAAR